MKQLIVVSLLYSTSVLSQGYEVMPIEVEENKKQRTEFKDITESIAKDGAEALEGILGVSIQRKGGHGNDPVIRGQKENRINIKIGDRFVHGGCPSRMDPPSSYVSTELYEEVEVQKGVYTLTHGRGGPAGTVIYKERDPSLEEKPYTGKVGVGYESNMDIKSGFAQVAAGTKKLKGKLKYGLKQAQNYDDGDGTPVESSFENQTYGANIYFNPNDKTKSVLKYEENNTKDALYSGLSMDAPEADLSSWEVKFTRKLSGFFNELDFSAYQSEVEHFMTNKLRNPSTLMEVNSEAKTVGGRLMGSFSGQTFIGHVGLDIQNVEQVAEKKHGGTLNTYMWPGAKINQIGLFSEVEMSNGLKTGLRVDMVSAEAEKSSQIANAMAGSASAAYQSVYGVSYSKKEETNIDALVRYTRELSESLKGFLGVSRTTRVADANERFIHKYASMASMRETGNPNIEDEVHTQIDLGLGLEKKRFTSKLNLYYNKVDDFISIDRARGQSGILVSDSRTIYRNVEAELFGLEGEVGVGISNSLSWNLAFNYSYGKNKTDNRPLYEIPPLEFQTSLNLKQEMWDAALIFKGASHQYRVDDDTSIGSGVDYARASGWAILDIQGSYKLMKSWRLSAGIKNLFDKTYAKHLNMRDVLSSEQTRINEPGRAYWLNTVYSF